MGGNFILKISGLDGIPCVALLQSQHCFGVIKKLIKRSFVVTAFSP